MAKKNREHTEPWVKVVTALSIIGLIALVTTLIYLYIWRTPNASTMAYDYDYALLSDFSEKQYKNKKRALSYQKALKRRWVRPLAPSRVQALSSRVEIPLEVVRSNPHFQRPKNKQIYMRERIDRLENNITLLKQTQRQEQALENLNERIKRLRKMDILY